jgi:acetyl-CoA carboxylase carboxyl transferase subunit beta
MPSFLNRRRFVSVIGRKSAVPDGLWVKCPGCAQAVVRSDVEENLEVCPTCGYHRKIAARKRIEALVDPGTFQETHTDLKTGDPLDFTVEGVSYGDKVDASVKRTGLQESVITGFGDIEETRTVLAVMDFGFMGGSMGSVFGEKFCRASEDAIRERVPFVTFTCSGGARMQEGVLSLMQMAKTCGAVRAMNDAGIPYIVILTDATTGGVYASFAGVGDVTLAEPGAEIGFTGKRLIEGALRVKIPDGFQTADYQRNNGFIDQIVSRQDMRPTLGRLLRYLTPQAA